MLTAQAERSTPAEWAERELEEEVAATSRAAQSLVPTRSRHGTLPAVRDWTRRWG